MFRKKPKIRAQSYKNKCVNCSIGNQTVFKKMNPGKQIKLKKMQKFEKSLDELVFSDDEDEDTDSLCSK